MSTSLPPITPLSNQKPSKTPSKISLKSSFSEQDSSEGTNLDEEEND